MRHRAKQQLGCKATRPAGDTVSAETNLLSIFLFSLVVALSASLMESLAGAGLPTVVRSGGTGFTTAVALCLAAVPAVRELRKRR